MLGDKSKTLTTGEVAKICQVTKRTVIKWIDSGKLRGYRIPGSSHRRVAAADLRRFMRSHRIPEYSRRETHFRILVVDDDPDFRELLRDALGDRYDLAFAGMGLEAASQLPVFEPDAIVLDVRLPDVSGLEVCKHFQSYRKERNVPILIVSAYGSELDLDDLLDHGADDFMPKPLKVTELEQRLRVMVG